MRTEQDARARCLSLTGRLTTLLWLLTVALALTFTASAGAAPPGLGTLTAMSGTSGCQMVIGGSLSCTPAAGLAGAESAVVSPDGRNVYVTSYPSSSPNAPGGLAAFSRDPATGTLTQLPGTSGCMTATGDSAAGTATCSRVRAFGNGDSRNLAITPDGKFVYLVSAGSGGDPQALVIFSRNTTTGALTQLPGTAGCITPDGSSPDGSATCQAMPDLGAPDDVTSSPDGRSLYVGELTTAGAILVLARDPSTGALSEVQCLSNAPAPAGCDIGRDLGFSDGVVISPDGRHAFSSAFDSGISSLDRDPATGRLTQPIGAAGCISEDGTDGQSGVCAQGRFLEDPISMAITPDGHTLYAVANTGSGTAGLALIRVAADGSLRQPPGVAACSSNTGHDQGTGPCEDGREVDDPAGVTISPDGNTLYVSDVGGNAGGSDGLAAFTIVSADGSLSQGSGAEGCITADGSADGHAGTCGTGGAGLEDPEPAALSPDGTSLYLPTFTNGGLLGFHRETSPLCQPVTTSTPFATSVTISLTCSDPDGDQVAVLFGTPPAHGTLGLVNHTSNTVTYTPAFGYSGPDSFTFFGSDGRNQGARQTATITVRARPPVVVDGPPKPLPTPKFSGVHQSHARWREHGKAKKHAPPVGTTFRFTLNTPAKVTLTFTQRLPGRRVGGRCVAPFRRHAKHRACTRTKARGSFSFAADPGINRRDFSGTIPHHGRLPVGRYTVTLTAKRNKLHSAPKSLRFTIVA
jgi:DNA-binding beta-propeller fold protein YncE